MTKKLDISFDKNSVEKLDFKSIQSISKPIQINVDSKIYLKNEFYQIC